MHQGGNGPGRDLRTVPFGIGQQRLGRRNRFGYAFFCDIDREFRRLDQIGLDLRRPLGVDALDAVAP